MTTWLSEGSEWGHKIIIALVNRSRWWGEQSWRILIHVEILLFVRLQLNRTFIHRFESLGTVDKFLLGYSQLGCEDFWKLSWASWVLVKRQYKWTSNGVSNTLDWNLIAISEVAKYIMQDFTLIVFLLPSSMLYYRHNKRTKAYLVLITRFKLISLSCTY